MPSTSFHITKNDTAPPIQATLKAGTPAAAVDLTGASVQFHMKDAAGVVKVDAAASITDATAGEVEYAWQVGDTDTAGRFQAEWEVTFPDATVRTFPTPGVTTVVIHGEIA